ncbi:class C sortase [Tessaracoccus aquimaris]|nr:class C sortase [Tessaracoccus aquimaris]
MSTNGPRRAAGRPGWRMPWLNAGIGALALLGLLVMGYPSVASWFAQYNQSRVIEALDGVVDDGPPERLAAEIKRAVEFNDQLISGALVSPGSNIPQGDGPGDAVAYGSILDAGAGMIGRLRIPAIQVDLPIYHGTTDAVLEKGVGHLQGTSFPVGGGSQHSVLTAHRGLPSATLFNDLQNLKVGDTFTIETFGTVLTYRVRETQTIEPDETQALVPQFGQDLVTLVTCTPLGINTHRYLVTGERILPTPAIDLQRAGERPEIPGFPWWSVILGGACVGWLALVVSTGFPRRRVGPQNRKVEHSTSSGIFPESASLNQA